ncbi:MAG: hypothetical protein HC860_25890 [Alkalinema sp. RU_4_3]|nr:hypothetical protein [Alkalinema sp. RU_4_3]
MNDWNEAELAFRCERLSVRLERLAEGFLRMGQLSQDAANADLVLEIVKEIEDKILRLGRTRLARELALLDPQEEQRLAEEGLDRELSEWPEY